ncbi:MAG: DNA double-strand break repair nuclease NurA [Nanobdellota archaeon]
MEDIIRKLGELISPAGEKEIYVSSLQPRASIKPTAYIDGGNNEIFSSTTFNLQLIRAAAIIFSKNRRYRTVKEESLCLITEEEGICTCDFDNFSIRVKAGLEKGADIARRIYEIRIAEKLSEELEQSSMIVMDGPITSEIEEENKELADLKKKVSEKKILLAGLIKTQGSVKELPKIRVPEGRWFKDGLVRLHPRSEYIFRYEINDKENTDIKKVLGVMASNSDDPVFYGYPYGLISADKTARVPDEDIKYRRTKIINGLDNNKLKPFIKAVDAHEKLDSI